MVFFAWMIGTGVVVGLDILRRWAPDLAESGDWLRLGAVVLWSLTLILGPVVVVLLATRRTRRV